MNEIQTGLKELAVEHGVEVLFACESGSWAWGIESPDSDYDIRFLYLNSPDWYVRLHEGRDVIERLDGLLDYSGWDIRKALRLAYKSNPALLEWLQSKIVYATDTRIDLLRAIMQTFSAKALMHHYVSLADRQKKAYWKDGEPVRLKKYLYAVRPLYAVYHMERYDYQMPPIELAALRDGMFMGYAVENELDDLLALKAKSSEIDGVGRYPALDAFIDEGLADGHDIANLAPDNKPSLEALNALFRSLI